MNRETFALQFAFQTVALGAQYGRGEKYVVALQRALALPLGFWWWSGRRLSCRLALLLEFGQCLINRLDQFRQLILERFTFRIQRPL